MRTRARCFQSDDHEDLPQFGPLAGGPEENIQVVEFPSGRRLSSLALRTSMLAPLALHPGGSMLAGVPNENRQVVQVWDTRTGVLLKSLPHGPPVECLAFSPDGRCLATGGSSAQEAVKLWDLATGPVRDG